MLKIPADLARNPILSQALCNVISNNVITIASPLCKTALPLIWSYSPDPLPVLGYQCCSSIASKHCNPIPGTVLLTGTKGEKVV